jgi:hypothetical protein
MPTCMFIRAKSVSACIGLSVLACAGHAAFANDGDTVGVPWVGPMGISESVATIMERERLSPPIDLSRPAIEAEPDVECDYFLKEMRRRARQNPDSPNVPWWPYEPGARGIDAFGRAINMPLDGAGGPGGPGGPSLPQTLGRSFRAVNRSESIYVPPDTEGAVGPTQIFLAVNGRCKVFDKNGVLGALNVTADNLFQSVRGGQAVVDPRARFDTTAVTGGGGGGRWIISSITIGYPNRLVLAVSDGPTISSASSFRLFGFVQDAVGTPGVELGALADYASLGVDRNAVYLGTNQFTRTAFVGSTGWVIRKSSVLGTGPIVVTPFRQICTPNGVGLVTPMGVDNNDPAPQFGFFIGTDGQFRGRLVLRRVTNAATTPTISSNINLTVPTTTGPLDVPAFGSNAPLSAIDDRLIGAKIHRDRNSNARTLWTAHHFEVDSTGRASDSGGRNGVRWYQIRDFNTSPALVQSGTLFDPATNAPKYYWMGSVAMSGQGHAAIGASVASASDRAGVAVAGRLRSDTPGATQAPTLAQAGIGEYNAQTDVQSQRWGDYSHVVVDPADDQTMWAFQEYCDTDNSWAVRVVELKAPPPATPSTASPAQLERGTTLNVTITGASTAGSGFYDTPQSGSERAYARLQAAFSGTGITINSITYSGPTSLVLNVTVATNAPGGGRTLTITNPDGQQITSASGLVSIGSAVGCPVFNDQPQPVARCTGEPAAFTIRVTGNSPISLQWQKDGQDIPGATNTTYSIPAIAIADAGDYTCVATNPCGSTTSQPARLSVNVTPFFIQQPADQEVRPGDFVTIEARATGLPAPTFQWQRNSQNITGATNPFYQIANVRLEDQGVYTCVVRNSCGSATSEPGRITVICPADFDRSGSVDFFDYLDFVLAYALQDPRTDFDRNGTVDFFDYLDFINQFTTGC